VWNADISLTGPKAGGSQARFARSYTVPEKISELIEYLEKEQSIGVGRNRDPNIGKSGFPEVFRTEECWATRVFIPPKQDQVPDFRGLGVWVSLQDEMLEASGSEQHHASDSRSSQVKKPNAGDLLLIEDFKRGDEEPFQSAGRGSGFTLLGALLTELQDFDSPSAMLRGLPVRHRLNSPLYDERVWGWAFGGDDPFGELSQIGAHIGPQRAIRTLYRIRYSFWNPGADYRMSTVGYPIFVAAAY
jgi:hypothetical protein